MSDAQKPPNNYVSSAAEQTTPQKVDGEPGSRRTSVEVPSAPKGNGNADEKEKNPRKWWETVKVSLPFLFSIISLVITFKAYQNTGRSADAAEDSAGAAKRSADTAQAALKATIENARIDKRAWVVVSAIWLMKPPIAKQQMRFIVEIQNIGETPGLKVVRRIQFSVSQPSNLGAFQNISDRSGSVVVPPGGGAYNSLFDVSEDEAPTEMQIAEVINGNSSLYLYGIVDYEDIFGSKHFTRFCGRYGIDRNLASPQFSVFPLLKFCENDDYNYME